MDIDLPEVRATPPAARFFNEDGVEKIEISFTGTKDTCIKRVKPEHMVQFRDAWNAYCDGRPMAKREGTPLTDMPEIKPEMAEALIRANVHNLEEMAVLNDAQCQALGHGVLTWRKRANEHVAAKRMRQAQSDKEKVARMSETVHKSEEASLEVAELRLNLEEQSKKIDLLVEAMTRLAAASVPKPKGKPGRPKKNGTEHAVTDSHPNV